jgi:hypothetical protein
MIFKSLKSCKWSVGSDTYLLTSGTEVEIKDEYISHAKASGLFSEVEVTIKKEENAKPIKLKVNSKSSNIK